MPINVTTNDESLTEKIETAMKKGASALEDVGRAFCSGIQTVNSGVRESVSASLGREISREEWLNPESQDEILEELLIPKFDRKENNP